MPENNELSAAAADFDNNFAEVFGEGTLRTFRKLTWNVRFLNVNDLIAFQKRYPGTGFEINTDNLEQMRFFLYLALRKSDPRLSTADVEAENWKLTENHVGALLDLKTFAEPETETFLEYLLTGSGLKETADEAADTKN